MVGKAGGTVKNDFNTMVSNSMKLLSTISTESPDCHCVPGKDSGCNGCNLASKHWGIGAFGAMSYLLDPDDDAKPVLPELHATYFEDAAKGFTNFRNLRHSSIMTPRPVQFPSHQMFPHLTAKATLSWNRTFGSTFKVSISN